MKVTEKGRADGGSRAASAQRFDEVLRNARRGVRVPHRAGAVAAAAEGDGAPAQGLVARRATAERTSGVLRERRAATVEAERQTQPPPAPVPQPQLPARIEAAAELRAAVRALPVAIEAARVREGEPLSLSLGRALSVDLRRGAGGLELVLRPAPALQRAAAAELPGLVEALRARGITVARAEVRAQPNAGPPAGRSAR